MSTPAVQISPQHVEVSKSLQARGYAVVRNLLDHDLLARMQGLALTELESVGCADGLDSGGQPRYVPSSDEAEQWAVVMPELGSNELGEDLVRHKDVLSLMEGVLNAPVFVHPNKWPRAVPPLNTRHHQPAGVHQDYPELQGSVRQLTMWCPLFPVRAESGSLPVHAVDPAAAMLPAPLVLDSSNASGWRIAPEWLGAPAIFDLEPGDVLVFRTTTPHGGSRNSGTGWRVSLEARFQPMSDPIAEGSLRPYFAESWDEHYEGWQRHAFYWRDAHPEPVPFDPSWELWRDIEAVRGGRLGDPNARRALEIAAGRSGDPLIRAAARDLLATMQRDGDHA